MAKKRIKMTKNVIPEGFSLSLALVDFIPVIFFSLSCIKIGKLFNSYLFIFGAIICLVSGFIKVIWKIVVSLKRKNIWWMFLQMRICMPIGFIFMLLSLLISHNAISFKSIMQGFTHLPSMYFFIISIIGMIAMSIFAIKLDSSDSKSNWIEQLTNSLAQISFFIGLLLL